MENQHRKISGYRELSQQEIDLMNKIKALGPVIEEVLLKIEDHVKAQVIAGYNQADQGEQGESMRLYEATPERFIALAKTELQTGLMYLTRAVAQPTFF